MFAVAAISRGEAFALERAVADRFGDVTDFDRGRTFKISDRARNACQPVERAGREVAVRGSVAEERDGVGVERAMAARVSRTDGRVGLTRSRGIALALQRPRAFDASADRRRRLARRSRA